MRPCLHLGQTGNPPSTRPSATRCTRASLLPVLTWLFFPHSAASCAEDEDANDPSSFCTCWNCFAVRTPLTDFSLERVVNESLPSFAFLPAGAPAPGAPFRFPDAAFSDPAELALRSAFHIFLTFCWSAFLRSLKPWIVCDEASFGKFAFIHFGPFMLGKHSK